MQCEIESQVIHATRTGTVNDQLRTHINTCSTCRETEQIALSFHALAKETDSIMPPVPDPSLIWREAYIRLEPARSNALLYLISAAVMVLVMITGYFSYGLFFRAPQGTTGSLARLPLGGIPFPNDSGLLIILFALALVIFLPKIGPSRPKNCTGTMVSL